MFAVSKQARLFLHSNIVPFINEFENEGLITYEIDNTYEGFKMLERLYFSLLKRTIPNRILTIRVSISLKNNYLALKQCVNWIKDQNQHIKLRFKADVETTEVEITDLTSFLNENSVIELELYFDAYEEAQIEVPFCQNIRKLHIN